MPPAANISAETQQLKCFRLGHTKCLSHDQFFMHDNVSDMGTTCMRSWVNLQLKVLSHTPLVTKPLLSVSTSINHTHTVLSFKHDNVWALVLHQGWYQYLLFDAQRLQKQSPATIIRLRHSSIRLNSGFVFQLLAEISGHQTRFLSAESFGHQRRGNPFNPDSPRHRSSTLSLSFYPAVISAKDDPHLSSDTISARRAEGKYQSRPAPRAGTEVGLHAYANDIASAARRQRHICFLVATLSLRATTQVKSLEVLFQK
ncbi:uncharacterized protein BJX67DRAFT_278325 [Aspergillus lucknowensis]|uniref:Uncharacterized protein n=1 Tax=Aspergillus lucknowensis TaxID=176173 RepID=A0ABR4M0B5_9EURO